jgi:DNA-binding transcriptional LysR family regulator
MAEPEWGDFKIMLALGRGGSVAGAARILGVDSSTVSRRLTAMEEAMGATLIIRGGREFLLTPEGQKAFATAELVERAIQSTTKDIAAAKNEIAGLVRISTVPSLTRALMQFVEQLAQSYPNLSIELGAAGRIVDLAKGEADIAIRMVKPTEIDVIGKRAFEWAIGLYASKAYAAKHGLPTRPDDLKHHKLLRYVDSMLHLPWFNYVEAYCQNSAGALRVDSTETAMAAIVSGAGIGAIACKHGDANPDLVRALPEPINYTTGWIVYHESNRGSARIKTVIDLLCETFDQQKDLYADRLKV